MTASDAQGSEQRGRDRTILKTSLVVGVAQVVFRGGEIALPLLLLYWFGAGSEMDVYNFAWTVFWFAGSLVFTAYRDSPLVPVIAEEKIARPAGLPRLLGTVLVHTWIIGGALAALVGVAAFGWFAYRYGGAERALATGMVLPFSLFLLATATRTFFATLLSVERHFVVQSLVSGVGTVVTIAAIAAGHATTGILLVPAATLAGELVMTAGLAWYAIRIVGIRVELCRDRPAALVGFARLVWHQIAGGAVTRVNPVVDQLVAGLTGVVGAITVLRYSGDVALTPTTLLQAALLPVLLSHLSEDFAKHDLARLRTSVIRSLLGTSALLVVVSIVMHVLRHPMLRFIYLHGEATEASIDQMAELVPYHIVGLAPFGALLILARAHIAIKNTGIFVGIGVFNAASNVVLDIVLVKLIGLPGLALATSIVHTAVAIVFWFLLERRLRVLATSPPPALEAT